MGKKENSRKWLFFASSAEDGLLKIFLSVYEINVATMLHNSIFFAEYVYRDVNHTAYFITHIS